MVRRGRRGEGGRKYVYVWCMYAERERGGFFGEVRGDTNWLFLLSLGLALEVVSLQFRKNNREYRIFWGEGILFLVSVGRGRAMPEPDQTRL